MNKITKVFMILTMLLLSISVSAQRSSDEELMKIRARQKVAQMNDYISFMADKSNSLSDREYYRTKALKLFIGYGNEYWENGVRKEGVLMETSSVYRTDKKKTLMRKYFSNLIKLLYTDVKIYSTELADIKVSNLRRTADGMYKCTCEYVQIFQGYRDGVLAYRDKTTKRIECYIKVEWTPDGVEYIVMLGDTSVTQTVRI